MFYKFPLTRLYVIDIVGCYICKKIKFGVHRLIATKYKSSQTMYKDNNYKSNSQSFMLNMLQRYLPITVFSVIIDRGDVMRNTVFTAQLRFRIV